MMIIPSEDSDKSSDAKMMTVGPEHPEVDDPPPPSYTSHVEPSTKAPSAPVFKTKPTNHLTLANEHNSLKGEFVIDPSIQIPSSILPPLKDGETEADRKNLRLSSRYGSVHAEIWLLPSGSSNEAVPGHQKPLRTTIDLTSDHGSINVQLQRLEGAASFMMTACAPHGSVKIALPRSFQGLLSLSTRHGSISLTDKLMSRSMQLAQLEDARRYFIGDLQSLGDGEWNGDEVVITSMHGHIRIKYGDEVTEDSECKGGFFSRLFRK